MISVARDEYARKILMGTSTAPKTPAELSRIYDIPIATCYERIRYLEAKGFIERVLTLFTREGKVLRFYSRTAKQIPPLDEEQLAVVQTQ